MLIIPFLGSTIMEINFIPTIMHIYLEVCNQRDRLSNRFLIFCFLVFKKIHGHVVINLTIQNTLLYKLLENTDFDMCDIMTFK